METYVETYVESRGDTDFAGFILLNGPAGTQEKPSEISNAADTIGNVKQLSKIIPA